MVLDRICYICYACYVMGRLNILVPEELHREVKVRAAEQGLTIIEAVVQAIRDWLRK